MNYFQRKIYLDLVKSIFTSEGYENMKMFYQKLKLTQFYEKFRIREINGYNMLGEWTETI